MEGQEHVAAAPVHRRAAGLVSRSFRGSVLLAGVGRSHQRLEGAAAVVWLVLDHPGSAADLTARIEARWPNLFEAGGEDGTGATAPALAGRVTESLVVLVEAGLVEVDGAPGGEFR